MKCANCGAEIKLGCVYCSVCGKEAQIVPDYNVEEDILKELLEEDDKPNKNASSNGKKKKSLKNSQKTDNDVSNTTNAQDTSATDNQATLQSNHHLQSSDWQAVQADSQCHALDE